MAIRVAAFAILLAMIGQVHASDLDLCAFNKTNGSCSATHSLNRETNFYTIPADGTCRTVTVQIDGTQYPHKQKDHPIVDSVMVLQKGKPYSFQVSGCTSHPTKEAVASQCWANTPRCPKSKTREEAAACWSGFADAVNQCIGARAVQIITETDADGNWAIRANWLNF